MVSGLHTLLATCFWYISAMPEKQTKRKRNAVLRMLGIGGGAGFVFVAFVVILAIIWAVEP